jgi:8-oxo-dGTP diphosphatase
MIKQGLSKPFDGQWRHPGGKFESNESPIEGLKREVKEETGLEIEITDERPIAILKSDYTDKYFGFYRARCKNAELKVNKREVEDFGWFTLEEIKKLNLMNATKIFDKEYINNLKK